MLTVARKERLLEAFRVAGRRGLTAAEMQARVGVFWRLRLRELVEDGCTFCEVPSRLRRGTTFRWVLLVESPVDGDDGDGGVDEPAALFTPPAVPPASAIGGE